MLNEKPTIIFVIIGLIKKISLYKMNYFLEPNTSKNKIELELNLSNYATKSDLKIATSVDTSNFAKKTDQANLKTEFDKLDIDKLITTPDD